MRIVSSSEMAQIDQRAQEEFNYPEMLLMENAGIKLYSFCFSSLLQKQGTAEYLVFIAGGGNNGGDALVMARQAFVEGRKNVSIIIAQNKINKIVSAHLDICRSLGMNIVFRQSFPEIADELIVNADIIFDGMAGTGLSGELRSPFKDIAVLINSSSAFVVSIDIPSGLGDKFSNQFTAVSADATLTVGLPKISLYLPYARKFCGKIYVVPIGFPPVLLKNTEPGGVLLSESDYSDLLPGIESDVYKNRRGSIGIFAGSTGTGGAAYLSASAAARSRTGIVTVFLDNDIYSHIAGKLGAVMAERWDPDSAPDTIDFSKFSTLLAGPGWGIENRKQWLKKFISGNIPGVLDADGINVLKDLNGNGIDLKGQWVLTPHPGEFCSLAGISRKELFSHTILNLLQMCRKYNAVIVLKSSVTYIGAPDDHFWIVDGMNPALATAGSGDLLAGIIAGFLSGGVAPSLAARLGVLLHSIIGRIGFAKFGWFIAEDLLPLISAYISGKEGRS